MSVIIQSGKSQNFQVVIEDDGKGFLTNAQFNGHYGLENMRSRAQELGARLDIVSVEEQGTKISISK